MDLDENVKRELLEASEVTYFGILLWKYKISDNAWRNNKDLIEHYEYLKSIAPKSELYQRNRKSNEAFSRRL